MVDNKQITMKPQFLATLPGNKMVAEMFGTDEQTDFRSLENVQYVDVVTGNEDDQYRLAVDDYFLFHIAGGIKLGFGVARQHKGTPIFERRKIGDVTLIVVGYEWLMNDGQYKMKQVALIDVEQGLVQMSVEGVKMKG